MLDLKLFGGNSFFYPGKGNIYLCFKTLEKSDRQLFIDGFNKLSAQSVYHRFFGFMKELTEEQLENFLNTDKKDHIAWAAFDIIDDEVIGIGVGRFKRSNKKTNEAELALTVIDDYQDKGVGTILLGIMYYLAMKVGIEVFTGIIMSDNTKLIKRFKELGAHMKRQGSEYEMRLPVHKDFHQLPITHYSTLLRAILQFLKENNFCV